MMQKNIKLDSFKYLPKDKITPKSKESFLRQFEEHSGMNATSLNNLYKELDRFKLFKVNTINTILYLDLVEHIAKRKNVESIPILLEQFSDDKEYYVVLKSVRHLIERYYPNVYLKHVLKHFKILLKNAPEWAGIFAYDILKTTDCLNMSQKDIICLEPEGNTKLLNRLDMSMAAYKNYVLELRFQHRP